MPEFIDSPTIIKAPGDIPKIIKEFFGCVNSGSQEISIAKMESPAGWSEPARGSVRTAARSCCSPPSFQTPPRTS